MATPTNTARYALQAPTQVLTDPMLWQYIVSFQAGLPLPLYHFWVTHEPEIAHSTDGDLVSRGIDRLLELVITHGSVEMLDALASVQYNSNDPMSECDTVDLTSVVDYAIEADRPDMLEWAFTHDAPIDSLRELWERALDDYQIGDFRVLDVLRIHKPFPIKKLRRLTGNVKDLELARWLDDHFPGALVESDVMYSAVEDGNVSLVEFLLVHYPNADFATCQPQQAPEDNFTELLHCLVDKRPKLISRECIKHAIRKQDKATIEVIQQLNLFKDVACEVADNYVSSGQLDKVQGLLDDEILRSDYRYSIDHPAAEGNLDMIKALEKHGFASGTTNAMDEAAENAKWDVVMYLHTHRSEGCTTRVIDAAAAQGKLDKVNFFHQNRSEGCTTGAMDGAAANGLLTVVRFLHENRTEGCTAQAMDSAAEGGHLHVVKFLHEHRSEGCTTDAMDLAAANGHFNVVQFLHSHRAEGCTGAAVKNAAEYGRLSTVRFLYEHYRARFGVELLHDLLLHGAFEIWMELRTIYPDEASEVVERVMMEAGAQFELATIHFVLHELGRSDFAHLAVDGAATRPDDAQAQWQRAVMTVAGLDSCYLSAVRNAAISLSVNSSPAALFFLIAACSEAGATEAALDEAKKRDDDYQLALCLEKWIANGSHTSTFPPVHPLLLDARCPSWAIRRVVGVARERLSFHGEIFPSWAVEAVYRNGRTMLQMLLRLRPSGSEFSFDGVQAAAVRAGNLPMLQWLLNECALPAESTLLYEALFYHQFEIAEWLVENCIDGCRKFKRAAKKVVAWKCSYGVDDFVPLDYPDSDTTVQSSADYGALVSHAVKWGNLVALRQIHKSQPELFKTHQEFASVARRYGKDEVLGFLDEIRYPFMDVV